MRYYYTVTITKGFKMLFFNKQYRAEMAIFSRLANKINTAKTVTQNRNSNKEIYTLDNKLQISLDVLSRMLTVTDMATSQEIISFDCQFGAAELQEWRWNAFSRLLQDGRKRIKRDQKLAEKQKRFDEVKARIEQAQKQIDKEKQAIQALKEVERKLR